MENIVWQKDCEWNYSVIVTENSVISAVISKLRSLESLELVGGFTSGSGPGLSDAKPIM